MHARQFTVQERIAQQIANSVVEELQPYGVVVYLEAHHACTQCRGVREMGALTRSLEVRGEYGKERALVGEALFPPETAPWFTLQRIGRGSHHLFLRYRRKPV
jgi:GTP cyclohydrolase I